MLGFSLYEIRALLTDPCSKLDLLYRLTQNQGRTKDEQTSREGCEFHDLFVDFETIYTVDKTSACSLKDSVSTIK